MTSSKNVGEKHKPAHLEEESVRFGHTIQLMFVLLQQVNVTLFWNKLQELQRFHRILLNEKRRHQILKAFTSCR